MKRSSKRRNRVKYVDPVTDLTEYRYVEKVTYRYEDEEKLPTGIEFLTGDTSAEKNGREISHFRYCPEDLKLKLARPIHARAKEFGVDVESPIVRSYAEL